MMKTIKKAVTLGFGVVSVSREKAREWANEHQVMEKGELEKAAFKGVMDERIQRGLHKVNISTKLEYASLEKRIQQLEGKRALN